MDRSYEWQHILAEIKRCLPDYKMPPKNWSEAKQVTLFDPSRRDELLKIYACTEFYAGALMTIGENVQKTISSLQERGEL